MALLQKSRFTEEALGGFDHAKASVKRANHPNRCAYR